MMVYSSFWCHYMLCFSKTWNKVDKCPIFTLSETRVHVQKAEGGILRSPKLYGKYLFYFFFYLKRFQLSNASGVIGAQLIHVLVPHTGGQIDKTTIITNLWAIITIFLITVTTLRWSLAGRECPRFAWVLRVRQWSAGACSELGKLSLLPLYTFPRSISRKHFQDKHKCVRVKIHKEQ